MSFRDEAIKRLTGIQDGRQARLTTTIEKNIGSYADQTALFVQLVDSGKMTLEDLLKVRPELFDEHTPNADVHFL